MFNPHTGEIEVLKEIWNEILKKLNKNGVKIKDIDLIVITGDISSISEEKDFNFAKRFLIEILFNIFDRDKIIIIPGNHDLKFAKKKGFTLAKRFQNYLNFKNELGFSEENIDSAEYLKDPHFLKIYDDYSTCILCLNSCLYTAYELDPNYPLNFSKSKFSRSKEKISRLNEEQLKSCLKSHKNYDKYNFKIVLLHHNFLPYREGRAYVNNFYKIASELGEEYGFKIILHGHLHRNIVDRYQNCITIGAGSFGVGSEFKDVLNELNLIKLRKEKDIFPITWIDVLSIKVDYDEVPKHAISVNQDWRSETLEMPTSGFYEAKSFIKPVLESISESDSEKLKESLNNFKSYLLTLDADKLDYIMRDMSIDFPIEKFQKIDRADYLDIYYSLTGEKIEGSMPYIIDQCIESLKRHKIFLLFYAK